MTTNDVVSELDKAIAFQARWQLIMSVSHTSLSFLTVFASGAATVVASTGNAAEAAVLAATATVSFGTEKALMLREKWIHHLATSAQLQSLRLAIKYGGVDERSGAIRMGNILKGYAISLPVAPIPDAPERPASATFNDLDSRNTKNPKSDGSATKIREKRT